MICNYLQILNKVSQAEGREFESRLPLKMQSTGNK